VRTSSPKRDKIASALRKQIADGTYPPGSRLPSRRDLAAEHGTSVAPVAGAFQDLQAEGLIRADPQSGYLVCQAQPRPPGAHRHLTVAEAAALLRVPPDRACALARSGELGATCSGQCQYRIPEQAALAYRQLTRPGGTGPGQQWQAVAAILRAQITAGMYPARSRLPAQRTLAAKYHISPALVRQAYRELAAEGLVRAAPGSNFYTAARKDETMTEQHAAGQQRGVFEVDAERAAEALRLTWGDLYTGIGVEDGTWTARPKDSDSHILTGETPDALNQAMRQDWARRSPP
jgi:excisionase family DNA binding protein